MKRLIYFNTYINIGFYIIFRSIYDKIFSYQKKKNIKTQLVRNIKIVYFINKSSNIQQHSNMRMSIFS